MNLLKRPLDDSAFRAESKKLRYEKWTEFQIQLETCMEKKCLCEVSLGDIIIHLGKFIRWGGGTQWYTERCGIVLLLLILTVNMCDYVR